MGSRNGRSNLAMLGVAVTVAMLAMGCSGGESASNKAGGAAAPVVLQMGNAHGELNGLPAVQYFVSQVKERSGGNLRIEVRSAYGDYANDAEQQVVRAVAAGEVDLGWAGTRVFDTMGVTSFQALQAPMLIDSYPLEQAVITAGIPVQMLQGLDKVRVRGIGVLADGLRKPVAVKRAVVHAADWQGIRFGTVKSERQADAIRALGATPMEVFRRGRLEALSSGTLDGFEMNLLLYENTASAQAAPYVTANVNLWPQMDVLLANPDRLAGLSEQQRSWLEQAAQDAAENSVSLADHDAQRLERACRAGARFANATKDDLAALHEAFAPVYASLEQDPQTKAFIQQIEDLKRSTPVGTPLGVPATCAGKAPAKPAKQAGSVPSSLNGTYRYELTKEDALRVGDPEADQFPDVETVTMRDGEVKGGCFEVARYSVTGNRITFNVPEFGYTLTFTFAVDDKGSLYLTPVQPMDPGDAFQCSYKPWTKIG
jgi:TRAP-type C4-dicarboxylate transport system substrate-binding protein